MLVGLPTYAGPDAQAHAAALVKQSQGLSDGFLGAPTAAFYGGPATGGFNVIAGAPCANQPGCVAGGTAGVAQGLRASGFQARAFPSGPGVLDLVCASKSLQGTLHFDCLWVGEVTAGQVIFADGLVTSLGEAAEKTRQIVAGING